MANRSNRQKQKKKNHGGERLKKWRLLKLNNGGSGSSVNSGDKGNGGSVDIGLAPYPNYSFQTPNNQTITNNSDADVAEEMDCAELQTPTIIEEIPNTRLDETPDDVGGSDTLLVQPTRFHTEISSTQSQHAPVCGRRIVDLLFLIKQLKELDSHSPQFGCTLKNMDLEYEIRRGLQCGLVFSCNMCNVQKTVWTDPHDSQMDINTAAVIGAMNAGGGFSTLEKVMGALNVRCMSTKTYDRHHSTVSQGWESSALEEMKKAAEEEISLAKERGDVDVEGVPLLTVVADGSWAKRSYKTKYNSLSGMAAIVGYYTRKVLYFGVKNKYCVVCVRNKTSKQSKEHTCFKNWTDSSTSMESAVIVEGFLRSEEMYGARYTKLIADGDSSVYHQILSSRPYENVTVTKIECRNHLLRNYTNKLREIATSSARGVKDIDQASHVRLRRIIGARILRCRVAVSKAIKYRKSSKATKENKISGLRKDILNGPCHVFGQHDKCDQYFCHGPKQDEANLVPDLIKCKLYNKLMEAANTLSDYTHHLLEDVDSNMVEHYNSSIARFTGGKRVNYTLKGSYQARCAAAVVNHNTGKPVYHLHKSMQKSSPGYYSKLYESRVKRKATKAALRMKVNPKVRRSLLATPTANKSQGGQDKHYGPLSQKPDMNEEEFNMKKNQFLNQLHLSFDERRTIEIETKEQSDSPAWYDQRRTRLTASNFGLVINRKPYSSCSPIVNRMLYSTSIDCAAMRYGRENEKKALTQLAHHLGPDVVIEKCGLFIDEDLPFLAATPDGLIGEDGIVEVKCPSSAVELTPEELVEQRTGVAGKMWKKGKDGKCVISHMHNYHLQVQGQLHVTKRKYCIFVVWTPKGMKTEKIFRDDDLWKQNMEGKLIEFYHTCLLPELVDPRRRRSMPIREPEHILKAQAVRQCTNK